MNVPTAQLTAEATRKLPIFDGHNDTLMHLYLTGQGSAQPFFMRNTTGHIDLPRAREGGFAGGFFAIYVPADPALGVAPSDPIIVPGVSYEVPLAAPVDYRYAQRVTLAMMALLFRIERESAGQVIVVRSAADLDRAIENGTLAAVMHIEGAEAIDPDLDALEVFYQAGLRSIGIVWSRPNAFAHGVPFAFPRTPDTGPGLTSAGRDLVRACNRLGVMLDLSHLNEQGFWDVAELTEAPLVATHTAVWEICNSTRNLTDKQLDAIRETDGMVGLNFHVSDLRPDAARNDDVPAELMIRHIDYLVERIGIDRVGFGSDFDGATIPRQIGDVTGVPTLVDALRQHGYDEYSLRKLTHENWQRVLRKTWKS